jgi:hypothetical protein
MNRIALSCQFVPQVQKAFFFFCLYWGLNLHLVLGRQVLYCLSHSTNPQIQVESPVISGFVPYLENPTAGPHWKAQENPAKVKTNDQQ